MTIGRPGSPGTLRWGSIFNGFFFIDRDEELIGIALGQLFPGEGEWTEKFMQLVYAAVDDWARKCARHSFFLILKQVNTRAGMGRAN